MSFSTACRGALAALGRLEHPEALEQLHDALRALSDDPGRRTKQLNVLADLAGVAFSLRGIPQRAPVQTLLKRITELRLAALAERGRR